MDESTNKIIILVGPDWGRRSSCFPRVIEEWGEYNHDSSEEMLTAAFTTNCIVAEDVITVDINIKFIALFPRFLNQPRANVILAHVINQVFKLG